jgi:hypothetical protein
MKLLALFIFCFLFVGSASANKFSSRYTDLDKSCKTIKGGEGQDDASDCRGIGGYRVHVWFSAMAQHIGTKTVKSEEMIPLATQSLDFDQTKIKLEWRLANGKPFAVIFRVFKYGEGNDDNPFGKKIGEELIVKGLTGFEKIDFKVDSKTPNTNAEARKLADNAYLKK